MTRRVLIVRLGALGDIVLALPAVERLKRLAPELELSWLVGRVHAPILAGHPALHEVIPIDTQAVSRSPLSLAGWVGLARGVRALRARRFDVAVDVQGAMKSAFLTRAAGARRTLGFARGRARERLAEWLAPPSEPPAEERLHASELYRTIVDQVLEAAPEAVGSLEPASLALSELERAAAAAALAELGLSDFVVINPGAAWITKRWPLDGYERLGRHILDETPLGIFVAWGPGEEELMRRLLDRWRSPRAVSRRTTVRELAAIVARARAFVGSDTGPYHVARAVGTPTLALFGPTDPVRNGPLPGERPVIWGRVACSPCYLRSCPTQIECMRSIEPERVISELAPLLGTRGGSSV